MMVVFNLIPAFPLDGGRVLRALLATRLSYERATQIAATVGQALALLMGIWAFSKGPASLALIAIFIYMGAESESSFVQMRHATSGIPVSSAMVTRFDTLNHRVCRSLDEARSAGGFAKSWSGDTGQRRDDYTVANPRSADES